MKKLISIIWCLLSISYLMAQFPVGTISNGESMGTARTKINGIINWNNIIHGQTINGHDISTVPIVITKSDFAASDSASNSSQGMLTGLGHAQIWGSIQKGDSGKTSSRAREWQLNGKQAKLVSGSNIKTINGTSLLGSTDIVVAASLDTTKTDAIGHIATQHDVKNILPSMTGQSGKVLTNNGSVASWATVTSGIQTYIQKTSTYAILTTDQIVECISGTFTTTLPTAVGVTGKEYTIINSGTGVITVATTSSQLISGQSSIAINYQYQVYTVISNGANWIILSIL